MITSVSNQKIKNVIRLKKSTQMRRKQHCFIVEGPRMFFEVPVSALREVYITEEFEKKYKDRLSGTEYELVSETVCRHLSDTTTPQGVVAVVDQPRTSAELIIKGEGQPCIILLESIQDPGNLGTILRTAEACGVSGVITSKDTVDPFHPKVVRSTMGAVFRVPFHVAEDFHGMIRRLKEEGYDVYAAHLDGQVFYDADYKRPCAFVIGNEGNGLTAETTALCDRRIRIPMQGKVESLNASVAASLIMYEVFRQRRSW